MNVSHGRDASRLCTAASAVLVFLMLSLTAHAADVRYLWQSRDQFVALERQDTSSAGPAQPNDHPVDLTLDRITAILESIDMRATDGSKAEALLTRTAVQALAPYLLQGLQQASAGEDVTFAVIGLHEALYGLAKSPKVTTGRVFYKAGRLNIIVGLVQQEVRDRDDRRLFPFTPGSRQKVAQGEWKLLPPTGQNGFALIRKDWLTISDQWQPAIAQQPVVEQHAPSAQTAPARPEKPASDSRRPADRLSTLNELKDKGLISDEEYRVKRLEILNGL
jgi:hypothetical protein